MQWHGNTNKSQTKINVAEIKFATSDLFTNGKNHWGKNPLSEFKVTTPENPLLSITSGYKYKESQYPIPIYSWTLTPIPNWTCIVTAISPLNTRIPALTNQWCTDPNTWLTHQLEQNFDYKVLQFINNEDREATWSQNPWR